MNKKIYYISCGIVIILFFVILFLNDNKARYQTKVLNYSGVIQNIVYLDGQKGPDFKINGDWYYFGYHPDLVENIFIGCKIKKRTNEQGVWIESEKVTGHFVYYDVYSGIIKDKQYINRLNRYENKKK